MFDYRVGNLSPAMGARNQVCIRLSYRPASLCSMATQFQTRFLKSIPRPIAGLKFPTQSAKMLSIAVPYLPQNAGWFKPAFLQVADNDRSLRNLDELV
jgi:hypothetical protein